MKRLGQILKRNFIVSASVMMVYRANLVFFIVFETCFSLSQFLMVGTGFRLAGGNIGGWTMDEAFLLTAVNGLSHQLFICFFVGPLFNLPMSIWNGMFDYILLKPINIFLSIFAASQIIVSNLPSLLTHLAAVWYFVAQHDSFATPINLIQLACLGVIGLFVRVGIAFLCVAPTFFSERMSETEHSFWSIVKLGAFPTSAFPRWLEFFLRFILPVGMMAAFPTEVFFGKITATQLAVQLSSTIGFVAFAGYFFIIAVRSYKSVNSGA